MTKRKKQAMETRKRILKCALALFEEKGFENVSMQEIAESSQTSIGSIYHYFKSKEEMAAQSTEPMDDLYNVYFRKLQEDEAYRDRTAVEKLKLYYMFVHRILSQMENLKSIYLYSLKYPESNTLSLAENRGLYQEYQLLLADCRKEGAVRDGADNDEIIELLTQASRGMITDWLLRDGNLDMEDRAAVWFDLIWSRFGVS